LTATTNLLPAIAGPPSYAARASSDDPGEVASWILQQDGYHSRVVHGTGPYGFSLSRLTASRASVGWGRTRLANTVWARYRVPTFHLPLEGHHEYAFGRSRRGADAGTLMFLPPGTETTRRSTGGAMLAIVIETEALSAEVRGRQAGASVGWPLVPHALELSQAQMHELYEAIAEMVRLLEPNTSSDLRTHADRRLISMLASVISSSPAASRPLPVAARRLVDLEDWIEAHLADGISLGRLCEFAQLGERSLQLAFQARRGMSPMRFIAERRLAIAHQRISNASPDDDVTVIATRVGFTHLGRFSMAYRATFGESPSHTIRRRLQARVKA
jgi:AraC-like DNA-binding protein